ncbi:MAG: hypothetical protein AAB807_01240 [Patescibacteria group bacterium]
MKNKNKLLILTVLFLANILAAAGWQLFFEEIKQEKEKIAATRLESEKINIKIDGVKNLDNFLEDSEPERDLISKAFIGEKDLVVFVEELEKIALMSKVELAVTDAVLPRKDKKDKNIGPTFRINLKGEFEAVYRFAELLVNAPYQVIFENISFRRVAAKEKEDRPWQADFEAVVLSYE